VIGAAISAAGRGGRSPGGRALPADERARLDRLRAQLAAFFNALPGGDADLHGFLLASVAEATLPASIRGRTGAVYTDPGLAGFTLDAGLRALGRSPARLLDPACGGGAFLAEAAMRLRGTRVLLCGMDRDRPALAVARARFRLLGEGAPRISLRGVDALRNPPTRRFDLVIGNPPYVRQEALGGRDAKRATAARLERMLAGAAGVLGGKADLSVAFILLGLARLRPGGVLAYVTTNAWLDTMYGAPLRRFLAERAEVRLVAEWEGQAFPGAAINPVVIVIRRTERRAGRPALFARYAAEPPAAKGAGDEGRWRRRTRRVSPRRLASESRWGAALLRRPDVLEETFRHAPHAFARLGAIAALHYGTKPGLVEFFVLDARTADVEPSFLVPALTSTSEISGLEVRAADLPRRLFVCSLSGGILHGGNFPGASAHVRRGERRRTRKKARHTRAGVPFAKVPSVRGNAPWHSLRPRPPGDFAIPLLIRERPLVVRTPGRILATNMFYQGRFADPRMAQAGTAILNSVVALMAFESRGRINIGGRINVYGPELRPLPVPDPRRMGESARAAIAAAFEPLRWRPVGPVSEEILQEDRRALDATVLEAAGVPARFGPLLSEALAERVARRLRREGPVRR
jgi:SAM-dependent methyltransferase